MRPETDRREFPEWAGALALGLAAFIAYLPCLNGRPVWDDEGHITGPALRGLDGLLRIWLDPGTTQQYYPLLHSAFWLEWHLWGNHFFGYHALNVLLHACSAYLLTRILRRLSIRGAWLAGFIFALHPICTEAVAWISEQKSTLSGLFYFSAALVYLRFDESRRRSHYFIALLLFVFALLTKTVTATLPGALLLVLWWRHGAIRWRQDVVPLAPWLAIGAAAGLGTAWVERNLIGATGRDFDLTFAQRFQLAGRDIWFYAAKVVWPSNLTFIYPHWTIDSNVWWQYLFTAGVVAAAAVFGLIARRNRAPLAALLFFAGTLFPVLGFLNVYPFRFSYVADHFQYLACLAIIVPAAWLIARAPVGLGIALVSLLGLLTWRQTHEYSGPEVLYRTTLARNPSCWMASNNLAVLLSKTPSRRDEAIRQIREAIQLKPNYYEAHTNLGTFLAEIPGRQLDAQGEYREALRIKPDYMEAHFDLGNLYLQMPGRLNDALAEFRTALRIKPGFALAKSNVGSILVRDPARVNEGLALLRAAAQQDPLSVPVLMNLANALGALPGHPMEAELEYEEILLLDPRYYEARLNLGNLLLKNSDTLNDAVRQFRAAVALRPQSPDAHLRLAIALFRTPGKAAEAKRELETVLTLQPDNGQARQIHEAVAAGGDRR